MIYRIIYQNLTLGETWSAYFETQEKAEKHIQAMKRCYGSALRYEKHAYSEVAWE